MVYLPAEPLLIPNLRPNRTAPRLRAGNERVCLSPVSREKNARAKGGVDDYLWSLPISRLHYIALVGDSSSGPNLPANTTTCPRHYGSKPEQPAQHPRDLG